MENNLNNTQYGFRKGKSTATAIHCTRRLQEFAKRGHTKLLMVFLDWEKAFDKIYPDKLFEAMYRMGIPDKLIQVTNALDKDPTFTVSMAEHTSNSKKQETGIRQGCPLSPYLFVIVMAVLMHDIHMEDHLNLIRPCPPPSATVNRPP